MIDHIMIYFDFCDLWLHKTTRSTAITIYVYRLRLSEMITICLTSLLPAQTQELYKSLTFLFSLFLSLLLISLTLSLTHTHPPSFSLSIKISITLLWWRAFVLRKHYTCCYGNGRAQSPNEIRPQKHQYVQVTM